MKTLAIWIALAASASGASGDAREILSKARDAFLDNRERERFWNWTTTTTRSIENYAGRPIEQLPSVTVESPIRSDGRRCNAVLAWGDGREPYLANATADERCKVEAEVHELLNEASILDSARVKVHSQSRDETVLAVSIDKPALLSRDPFRRCTASLEGKIVLDAASSFPKLFDLQLVDSGCEQIVGVVNHYDDRPITSAMSTFRKGAVVRWEYQLQRDKSGHRERDCWICVRRHSARPLLEQARSLIIWGRPFELKSFGRGRRIVIDASTSASELAADVILKFSTEGKEK